MDNQTFNEKTDNQDGFKWPEGDILRIRHNAELKRVEVVTADIPMDQLGMILMQLFRADERFRGLLSSVFVNAMAQLPEHLFTEAKESIINDLDQCHKKFIEKLKQFNKVKS